MVGENKLRGERGDSCLRTECLPTLPAYLTAMNGPQRAQHQLLVTAGRCLSQRKVLPSKGSKVQRKENKLNMNTSQTRPGTWSAVTQQLFHKSHRMQNVSIPVVFYIAIFFSAVKPTSSLQEEFSHFPLFVQTLPTLKVVIEGQGH